MKIKNKNDIKIAYTILQINPNAVFSISGDDVNRIEWLEGTNPISNEDILAKQTELKTAYDNNKYQRDRVKEYPSIEDQLDMQYWDNVNGTTTWKDAIAKVKSDNPKE
jgi:hypothetical protein|tara:strand:+ start:422 stop:745 length:324 start_codon:yes stop_codon:yes gene_type:complete